MDQLPSYSDLSQMSPEALKNIFGVRDFFVYELDFAEVAGGAQSQGSFTVEADSNFLWQQGAFVADLDGAAQLSGTTVIPLMSCSIMDTGSGRTLMSGNVPISSIFGNGQLPFVLPTARFFRAQTVVKVNLLNFSAATDYTLKLQFIGTKFFKFAQAL